MPSRRHRYLTPFIDYLALIYAYIRTLLSIPLRTQQRIAFGKTTTTSTPKAQSSPNSTKRTALQYYKGKTVVLDLDETLVHSVQLSGGKLQTVHAAIQRKQIEVQSNKQSILYLVYKRPHADFFLKTISQWYKVVIFTASMAEYADPVIDWLDQDDSMVSQRYFRQSCVPKGGNYLKDISLAEPDLSKVCLVDNSPVAYELYQENGIPIPTWLNAPNDESLLDLLPLLDALRFTSDVRSILKLRKLTS
ncbi:hypothetical protein [Absidia glauca]|uniref:FCP1 homology domain-containing protein n=1 Tax=Absidia glauca TaxID=4829 RepID=A0A168QQT2_ABSGL|nr:hypothetical protein [Absidia glauca]